MAEPFDGDTAAEIIESYGARPELLVQILATLVERFGYVSAEAKDQLAAALNLSRADVHGVARFYHDFRSEPPGRTVVRICQAESCQAMGSRELTEHAERVLGIGLNETSADGRHSLEPVYCLGNCACSPAVMIDGRVLGRVDAERFDAALNQAGNKAEGAA